MATTVGTPAGGQTKTNKAGFWTWQNLSLKLHLWLGLASAAFLIILGVTGAIIAFEVEADHWLHPGLWHVKAAEQTLPEAQLIANVEQHYPGRHVRSVQLPRSSGLAQVMVLAPQGPSAGGDARLTQEAVFVDPYTGNINGERVGLTRSQRVLGAIHQFHLHMGLGETGSLIVSIATAVLVFETILGIVLWFRRKRGVINLKGSWFRISFDLHNVLGIYSALFVFLAALTGVFIGFESFEELTFKLTHSARLVQKRPPKSTVVEGATPITIDRAMEVARQTIPNAKVQTLQLPQGPTQTYTIGMRVPEETSEAVHSTVVVDQFSGAVLQKQNFATDSPGYKIIRFNRSLHTGDIFGFPTHLLMSLTSVILVIMVMTGAVIWWKKLAV